MSYNIKNRKPKVGLTNRVLSINNGLSQQTIGNALCIKFIISDIGKVKSDLVLEIFKSLNLEKFKHGYSPITSVISLLYNTLSHKSRAFRKKITEGFDICCSDQINLLGINEFFSSIGSGSSHIHTIPPQPRGMDALSSSVYLPTSLRFGEADFLISNG